MPRGSAILTGSGDLDKQGIKGIIHLANLSVDLKKQQINLQIHFALSIQQAISLAERSGYKSIAFPLIDNESLDLILPSEHGSKAERRLELAFIIMRAAFSQARGCKKLKKIVFVDYGDKVFSSAWDKLAASKPGNIKKAIVIHGTENLEKTVPKIRGITDYSLHKCKVIVNPAFNVEGKFVGSRGLSGFIASQTGSAKADIQKEIEKNITEFNLRLKKNY